jgi:hypothetical protein
MVLFLGMLCNMYTWRGKKFVQNVIGRGMEESSKKLYK